MSDRTIEEDENGATTTTTSSVPSPTEVVEGDAKITPIEPEPVKTVKINTTVVAKLNLADYQNSVPVIRELRIVNETEHQYSELELTLTSDPAIFKPKTWHIDALSAGVFLQIPGLDVAVDGALLARLTETEYATLSLVLTRKSEAAEAPREELARTDLTLEMLPRNQWGGLSHLPEMTAAFVQPNDLAVELLLKKAADLLRKNSKNAALDGYSSGAEHAWEIASAIWGSVAAMGLDYALPPASFEQAGQKVRSPSHLTEKGLATCFDLSLYFCAALEQAGLNPLLVFTSGHAFAGVWLKNEEFSSSTVDDITALRKRVKLNELVLFETTLVTQRPPVTFRYAIERGAQHLAEGQDEAFEMALDIRRARLQRIKPLASAESQVPSVATSATDTQMLTEPQIEAPPALPAEMADEINVASLDPKDRLARWQRKLLDLSLRNNLLNFKAGKKALKFEAPDPGALEDLLASGKQIKLMTRPDLMDGADPRDQALYESREREDVRRQHALDALKRNEVYIGLPSAELESRLIELYRGARTNLQEGGANTLFLAIGFLSWTREDREGQRYRAPLILVPVTLERKSARSGFTLVLHDDEPRFNPTLLEMLRQDFDLYLGVAEGELPRDESGLDIGAIWRNVAHAVKDIKGWEISEDIVLSMFSFAKYLMWKDLSERTEALRENPVVRHLLDTPRDAYGSSMAFPEDRRLDADYSPRQVFCPLPYDSSQLSAALAAAQGMDFVLIGPPGTGKSQTIVNMIAQFIALDKRVLFVSEKIAALDVVYRRLREVGLGEFCLEVHSNKASKTDVLAQLNAAWQARGTADAETWRLEADRLQNLRHSLNHYVERLHHRYPNGLNIYDAIGVTCAGHALPSVDLSWPTPLMHARESMLNLLELADRLEVNAEAIGFQALCNHPLAAIGHGDWSPSWQQQVIMAAREVLPVVQATMRAAERFIQAASLPSVPLTPVGCKGLSILAEALPQAAGHDWRFVLRPDARVIAQRLQQGCDLVQQHHNLNQQLSAAWTSTTLSACQNGLDLLARHAELTVALPEPWPVSSMLSLKQGLTHLEELAALHAALSVPYGEAVEQLDVAALLGEWEQAEATFWPKSWVIKRRISKMLGHTVVGEAEPQVQEDLRHWVAIRTVREQLNTLNPGEATVQVWKGAQTDATVLASAIDLQASLAAAAASREWQDEGFELIAEGAAGPLLKSGLHHMRALRQLSVELDKLDPLRPATAGLWDGLQTRPAALAAAMAYQQARRAIPQEGRLENEHELVASGECGATLQAELSLLRQRIEVEQQVADLADLRELTAGVWTGLHTQIETASAAIRFHSRIAGAMANLAQAPEQITALKTALQQLLGDASALLEPDGLLSQAGKQLLEIQAQLVERTQHLATAGHFTGPGQADFAALDLEALRQRCEAMVQAEHGLHAWCAWRKVRDEAASVGLLPLVEAMEAGHLQPGTVRKTFESNYARWWLNATVDQEPTIRTFVSAEHEQRIRDFRALDERFTALTRDLLRARLCAELPAPDSVKQSSEWGTLRLELSKKSRHKPLRELISAIPQALTKLTPCMLMSPLSIAQYLSASDTIFDVVIFDEASQIPVWDAIGAIARGRQVIMVGDPKQLPPTSFFDRAESTADNEDVEPDLESILDECLSANLPTRNLNWHYRSRHESLITFSNHRYYDSKLVTFPSPVTNDRAVSLRPVQGVYDKGGSRTNIAEARALVADLVARLRSPEIREHELTFGVVTFNSEQQRLIEDLLDNERRRDPMLERYFADTELEPVFVKNLESVQGDERDIIYFSITYGPDAAGVVSMNFGPLNRPGGERRLNVAVTRARHELHVFATLKPEKIDLARTQSIGVRDLKHFMEFAERGPRAIVEATTGSLGGFDSPFEEQVAHALGRKGWHVATQIGVSAFRIDLAVIDPDAPGRYLAGVECDGATYHRSATARDRDKLREQVLRGLGWDILRIWSTDWWIDPNGTAQKVHERLEALLAESRQRRARLKAQEEEQAAQGVVESLDEAVAASTPVSQDVLPLDDIPPPEPSQSAQYARAVTFSEPARVVEQVAVAGLALYQEADPLAVVEGVDPEAFFDSRYTDTLAAMIAHVITQEGPVLDSILARRIARAHGWVRTGARIRDRVVDVARQAHRKTTEEVGDFYWPAHLADDSALAFRRPADDVSLRAVDEISLTELAALARTLAARALRGDDLTYAMAREIGLQKVSAQARTRLEQAISCLEEGAAG
ncbi:DUF3320 domain-containing protein [Metapseudomonas furukawaii]|uniref:DUF3320 domain-containing protein n=1 Tax=Metapseudomonas furukawaii TaxID=1149133 RepID=UPI002279F899|nr:DUF3320 domain-containing protein [Pseudomonas furukawaii]WAG79109.1 DUF3320 domain-containing protein [Pseudomonas furukawaii]